jgi:hypothetical protein
LCRKLIIFVIPPFFFETSSKIPGRKKAGNSKTLNSAKTNYPVNRRPRSVPHIAPNANDCGFVKTSEQRETVVPDVLNVEKRAKLRADALKEKRVSYL